MRGLGCQICWPGLLRSRQSHTQPNEYVAPPQLFAMPVAPYIRLNVRIGPLSRGANGVRLNAPLTLCYRHHGGKQAVIPLVAPKPSEKSACPTRAVSSSVA